MIFLIHFKILQYSNQKRLSKYGNITMVNSYQKQNPDWFLGIEQLRKKSSMQPSQEGNKL